MDSDRSTLLATMYQDDGPPSSAHPPINTSNRSRRIRVGTVEYEVPSVEYVQQLEHVILQQGRVIEQHQRLIDRLIGLSSKSRQAQKNSMREMVDLRRAMSTKLSVEHDFS